MHKTILVVICLASPSQGHASFQQLSSTQDMQSGRQLINFRGRTDGAASQRALAMALLAQHPSFIFPSARGQSPASSPQSLHAYSSVGTYWFSRPVITTSQHSLRRAPAKMGVAKEWIRRFKRDCRELLQLCFYLAGLRLLAYIAAKISLRLLFKFVVGSLFTTLAVRVLRDVYLYGLDRPTTEELLSNLLEEPGDVPMAEPKSPPKRPSAPATEQSVENAKTSSSTATQDQVEIEDSLDTQAAEDLLRDEQALTSPTEDKLEEEPTKIKKKPIKKEPKKGLFSMFKSKPTVDVPTIAELTEGDSPKASLRFALSKALNAPLTLDATVITSSNASSKGDEQATRIKKLLEDVDQARTSSLDNGLNESDIAACLEEVGRALVIDKVDNALDASGKEFRNSAIALCQFTRNAGTLASFLNLVGKIGEVAYEGKRRRGARDKLYKKLLKEAAPALVDNMKGMMEGMGGEGMPKGGEGVEAVSTEVDFDTIALLRPVLKIKEDVGERMMNNVVQQTMMKSFGNMMKGEGKEGEPDPNSYLNMIEQMLDSGMLPASELETIKKQLGDQVKKESKMTVEELLQRKRQMAPSALQAMKPEEKRMFDLLDRLFGDAAETNPIKTLDGELGDEPPFPDFMGPESGGAVGAEEEAVDDGKVKAVIRKAALEVDETKEEEDNAKVTVRIKTKPPPKENTKEVTEAKSPEVGAEEISSVLAATAQNMESTPETEAGGSM